MRTSGLINKTFGVALAFLCDVGLDAVCWLGFGPFGMGSGSLGSGLVGTARTRSKGRLASAYHGFRAIWLRICVIFPCLF